MRFEASARPAGLAIAALILAACATAAVEDRVSEIRAQVEQVAALRERVGAAAQAIGDTGAGPSGGAASAATTRGGKPPDAAAGDPPTGGVDAADDGRGGGARADGSAAADSYRRGYTLFHQGRYAEAEAEFGRFLAATPAHPAAADARYWVGECDFARGRYREAIGAWRPVAASPNPADRPDRALLRIGAAFAALGDPDMARQAFRKVLEDWPDGDAVPAARAAIDALPAAGTPIPVP
jgi:tol-pal system protein YbgF